MAEITKGTGKPLQRISAAEKVKEDHKFFKLTADFYIGSASFEATKKTTVSPGSRTRDRKVLYEIYNNQIPLDYFSHVTNPFNTDKPEYQNWPAKIRPTTILRTNIDQLQSEYPKRPFSFFVSNLGGDAYNAFLDGLVSLTNKNLQRKLIQVAEQTLQASGGSLGDEAQQIAQEEIQTPEELASAYKLSYKDNLAVKGQKKLNRLMTELSVKRLFSKMFKDWLIIGEARSYKGVHNSVMQYKRISGLNWDGDTTPEFFEDGEWQVCRYFMSYSDIVDDFYDELKEGDHKKIENGVDVSTPMSFFDSIKGLYTDKLETEGKIPVYHVCWKGKQKMYKITTTDPQTGEDVIDYFDEAYVPAPGEKKEEIWVNCGYETWRIGTDTYVRMRELPNQRSQMNNFSYCKLPYNGKNFSDDHATNMGVMEIGLPFQIMYMIVTRALELTIAKSKGKIVLLDKNVIPSKNGWDEDKFFYYAEALGYGLIDRNGIGVDKSFNQYQVLDLTLYDSIQQLIELQQHLKSEWDDILGFSRQRKAQTHSGETASANTESIFQSTVITDMIFVGFEDFVEKELNGLLDLSKFTELDGERKLYNESELDYQLMESDPNEFANSELGVFVTRQEHQKLKKIESYVATFAQNGAKPTTVIEMLTNDNIAMMKASLRKIEDAESRAAQAQAQTEQETQTKIEEIRERYMQIEKNLDIQFMDKEYDRKEALEHIKGEYGLLYRKR